LCWEAEAMKPSKAALRLAVAYPMTADDAQDVLDCCHGSVATAERIIILAAGIATDPCGLADGILKKEPPAT